MMVLSISSQCRGFHLSTLARGMSLDGTKALFQMLTLFSGLVSLILSLSFPVWTPTDL